VRGWLVADDAFRVDKMQTKGFGAAEQNRTTASDKTAALKQEAAFNKRKLHAIIVSPNLPTLPAFCWSLQQRSEIILQKLAK
jgi:hypothetical protein